MRTSDAVAAFEASKRWANGAPTWRLRMRIRQTRRRIDHTHDEIERARLVALEHILRRRVA